MEQEYLTYDDINEILPNDFVEPADVRRSWSASATWSSISSMPPRSTRYKDKKRDDADDDVDDSKDQKLDILDDPVRMISSRWVSAC